MINAVDIETIIDMISAELAAKGMPYSPSYRVVNNNIMITCPYHSNGQESKPSMGIAIDDAKTQKGLCHCFTCNTVVPFDVYISNVFGFDDDGDFGRKWLAQHYYVYNDERQAIEIIPKEIERSSTYEEFSSYQPSYNNEYLLGRGIHPYTMQWFDIRDDGNGSVVFPVVDRHGIYQFMQKRAISYKGFFNDVNADKSSHLYGLYQILSQLDTDTKPIYIVESIIDALYLWSKGYLAVAIMQAHISEEQVNLLRRLPNRYFIVATDNDSAGDRGAELIKRNLPDKILSRVVFPAGTKDINDFTDEQMLSMQIYDF